MKGLYLITDPLLLDTETKLLDAVEQVLQAGVKFIQYRDKPASPEQKLVRAKRIVELCNQHQAFCIINDSVDLAKAAKAHGVHVGQSDDALTYAKQQLPQNSIIGVTCHNDINLAQEAQNKGASYVAFGRFFHSETKPKALPAQLDIIPLAKKKISIPIVAIGGINAHNSAQVISAGADAIAVIHGVFGQNNFTEAAETLIHQF